MDALAPLKGYIMNCYCEALEPGIICSVCEKEFFGVEIEEIELDEVW